MSAIPESKEYQLALFADHTTLRAAAFAKRAVNLREVLAKPQ